LLLFHWLLRNPSEFLLVEVVTEAMVAALSEVEVEEVEVEEVELSSPARGGGGGRGGRAVAARGGGGPNNARGDAAAAAGGNNPVVYIKNQVVQAMQRQTIDTSNLRDLLYGHLSNRAQAAFTYLPVPPPPPNAGPAQQVAPAATPASIARELLDLTNLRNLYVNSPGMEHLIPGVMDRITRLQNALDQAE
jgi:hypothetical protein